MLPMNMTLLLCIVTRLARRTQRVLGAARITVPRVVKPPPLFLGKRRTNCRARRLSSLLGFCGDNIGKRYYSQLKSHFLPTFELVRPDAEI